MGWYALGCRPGKEEETARSLEQRISRPVLEKAFLFSCDRRRKYLGAWHTDRQLLFPGYVFLETGRPEELSQELEQYRMISDVEVLEDKREKLLLPVKPEEEKSFRTLFGTGSHLAMSEGIIRENQVKILSGPLVGKEASIKKIDRHKRVAVLNLKLSGQGKELWAGLELRREQEILVPDGAGAGEPGS